MKRPVTVELFGRYLTAESSDDMCTWLSQSHIQTNNEGAIQMSQLTRVSSVVALCFLGAVGVAQVTASGSATTSATAHGDQKVNLKCDGDSGSFPVKAKPDNPDTVTFTTPADCVLKTFQFDQNAKGFTLKGTNSDGSITYYYDGTPINSPGYPFSYTTNDKKRLAGNGTGVIKN